MDWEDVTIKLDCQVFHLLTYLFIYLLFICRPWWSRGNVLAWRSKVREFKPHWGRWIFSGRKNPEHKFSGRDFKLGFPCLILFRVLLFLASGSLTNLKSQTLDPRLKIPTGGLVLKIFFHIIGGKSLLWECCLVHPKGSPGALQTRRTSSSWEIRLFILNGEWRRLHNEELRSLYVHLM
jgi:hypothetical protein